MPFFQNKNQLRKANYKKLVLKHELMEKNDLFPNALKKIHKRTQPSAIHNFFNPPQNQRRKLTTIRCNPLNQSYMLVPGMGFTIGAGLWAICYDQKTLAVVMLNDSDYCNTGLPSGTTMYGTMKVSCTDSDTHTSYIQRSIVISDTAKSLYVHRLNHFQYTGWNGDDADQEKLVKFHQFLYERNFLVERTPSSFFNIFRNEPSFAPIIQSNVSLGRCGFLIIADIYLRMMESNTNDNYCIEEMIEKVCKIKNRAVMHPHQHKLIYTHLIAMMESYDSSLKKIGRHLRHFVTTLPSIQDNTKNIKKFLTSSEWSPSQSRIKAHLRLCKVNEPPEPIAESEML